MRRLWVRSGQLVRNNGLRNVMRGVPHRIKLMRLRSAHGFSAWHLSPVEWRAYAVDLVRNTQAIVDDEHAESVVEIGCGLGGILARIRASVRVGYDTDEEVLAGARELYPGLEFRAGSFEEVSEREIGVAIAVNFMHLIPPESLDPQLRGFVNRCEPRHLFVDEVGYRHEHDFDDLLSPHYTREWTSREYPHGRRVIRYRRG